MARADDMRRELMSIFQTELDEHLSLLNHGVLALEQGVDPAHRAEQINTLFRAAHSLKGAARAVNLKDIAHLAHRLEDALDALRQKDATLLPRDFNWILAGVDTLRVAMDGHLQGAPLSDEQLEARFPLAPLDSVISIHLPSADQPPQEEGKSSDTLLEKGGGSEGGERLTVTEDTVRVATAKLDALMDAMGELLVARMHADQVFEQSRTLEQRMQDWQKKWRRARPHHQRWQKRGGPPRESEWAAMAEFLTGHETDLNALSGDLNALRVQLTRDRNHLQRVTDELQVGIRKTRMLPIHSLFALFPRMVRDLAHERGKDILLQLEGGDIEVDRQILELSKDPLIHLLRNAVDHGIEAPDQRIASGKSSRGIIRLRADQRGNHLVIEVADDGRGIDPEAVRQAALKRGLIGAHEAAALDEEATLNLIFHAGLSTARQVSTISGRGVGLDVARANLEQMRGLVRIANQPGQGVVFSLLLPLTLATSQVLLVEAGGQIVALPVLSIERILRMPTSRIGQVDGQSVIHVEGRPLPLLSLARLLRLSTIEPSAAGETRLPVVVLNALDMRLVLQVDDFLSTQEVVIKPLGRQLRRVRNVAGVTVLGDGRLAPVLNVADLVKTIQREPTAAAPLWIAVAKPKRIVVVDDSITTRTLEKNILESAGYEVQVFADGQEAWDWLRRDDSRLPDALVSDVNMPRMDGFALASAVKSDARLSRLPIVLVTSLDSPEDRLQGMEAGADAYIVKSLFDQQELLAVIKRFTE
ncbi:MAG: hybrid sensor histidine kinase/response regulator [Candidatus Competibacter sp.]|nr:hybrid sensor histidine kinase/response regulator [Candidatus Competibacter sp.]MDG4605137.1 hybrid sensor histidine kinase/response regulator [Candidatus Contendobacter sp.]HRD48825.1 hybrid sensor histidine kinase/response regulator [Candidatus Contendobacter sp.]